MWCSGSGLRNCKGEKIGKAPDHQLRHLVGRRPAPLPSRRQSHLPVGLDAGNPRNRPHRPRLPVEQWYQKDPVPERRHLRRLAQRKSCCDTEDSKAVRIYSTTILTKHRIYTLMHDPQYRLAIAWQNVAYNQPPHPGFFLGHGMSTPPRPNRAGCAEKELMWQKSPPVGLALRTRKSSNLRTGASRSMV